VLDSGTGVDLGEEHVEWDLHVSNHVPISNLDVLHFCRIYLLLECFNSNQLHFNRLDDVFGVLGDNDSVEGLVESAVGAEDAALEPELRHLFDG